MWDVDRRRKWFQIVHPFPSGLIKDQIFKNTDVIQYLLIFFRFFHRLESLFYTSHQSLHSIVFHFVEKSCKCTWLNLNPSVPQCWMDTPEPGVLRDLAIPIQRKHSRHELLALHSSAMDCIIYYGLRLFSFCDCSAANFARTAWKAKHLWSSKLFVVLLDEWLRPL